MTAYKNFTVDFPARIAELDSQFQSIASTADLEVSYTLMKLAAAFLLPYERIAGSSGTYRAEITDRQRIRKYLELDKRFRESTYCRCIDQWMTFDVENFDRGPYEWFDSRRQPDVPVHEVLETIRHAVAHSNLFFGGESVIAHVYLGSRMERNSETNKYRVIG